MRNNIAIWALAALACASQAMAQSLPLNPDVTQATIDQTICVSGYTKTIRPPLSYTNRIKMHLMRQEGLPLELIGDKILDHKISLEIGGSPDQLANFMLQDQDESHEKDRVEHCLKRAVCDGRISLDAAQTAIWRDWRSAGALCAR